MENKKKLSRWLLDNHKALKLRATQFKWVEEWLPHFHDFEVSIVVDGRTVKGRGIDQNSDLAFTKAGAEAIERAICIGKGLSSCGVAVHTENKLAKINARNELIERDRFFCHYLTKTAFQKKAPELKKTPELPNELSGNLTGEGTGGLAGELTSRLTNEPASGLAEIDFAHLQEKLNTHAVEIQIFEMSPLNSIRSMICIAQGEKTGLVLGLGASENSEVATQKALIECLMNVVAALYGKVFPMSLNKKASALSLSEKVYTPSLNENVSSPSPNHCITQSLHQLESHHKLYLKKKNLDNKWLFEGSDTLKNSEFVEPYSFEYAKLETEDSILKEAPLVAVRCVNPYLQEHFYGAFDAKYINPKSLHRFLGKPIKLYELNQLPHPLG